MEEYFQVDREGYVVEDFDNVTYLWADNIGEAVVSEEDYKRLLQSYKKLKQEFQDHIDNEAGWE